MQIRRRNSEAIYQGYAIAAPDTEPLNILEKIVWHKEQEVIAMQAAVPVETILEKLSSAPSTRNFEAALRQSQHQPALIAEVKKASPSRGIFRQEFVNNFDCVAIAKSYEQGGASCLSVLTDQNFFQGSFNNLRLIREAVSLPLLCKEFVIDPYQIYWARLHGADAVLLIAAILSDADLQALLEVSTQLQMTTLVEVHSLAELNRVINLPNISVIGINNRNLETFKVDLNQTQTLLGSVSEHVKQNRLWVSESGLYTYADLQFVASCGAGAVLVGESLVKQDDISQAVKLLLSI